MSKTAERTDFGALPTGLAVVAAAAANWALGTGPWLVDLFTVHAAVGPASASEQPIHGTLTQALAAMSRMMSRALVILAAAAFVLIMLINCAAGIWTRRREHDQPWADLTQTHDEIRDQWHAYLLDARAQLRSPALNDVTLPTTQTFLDAAEDAEICRRRGTSPSSDDLAAYADAVQRLQQAWNRVAPEAEAAGPPNPPPAAADLDADAPPASAG
ncbi:hypothetical protein [Kutzneria buriramensis]|uniref:hypothetical protein n=1 Tax=Kutzneria buriramensis TaxID=1045776 RepID=UPI001476B766|nr:hypothetical protein [Kutzneria buriramensis]